MRSNKTKDMIRSLLPSIYRQFARKAKSEQKRGLRRGLRQELRKEDFDDTKIDFGRDACVSDVVWHRRLGDKIRHFIRWCNARTEEMDTEDALSYVRSILPSSVIGDHAYGHWEDIRESRTYRRPWPEDRPQTRQSYIDSTTCRLKRALGIAPDLHQALNASIKRDTVESDPRRLLRGIHDVEAFVRAIAWPDKRGEDDLFSIERRVTRDLIARVEKGGREAALGVKRIASGGNTNPSSAFGTFSPLTRGEGRSIGEASRAPSIERPSPPLFGGEGAEGG